MRVFADQCVPNSVVRALAAAGHDVLRLRDHIAIDSPDDEVLAMAGTLSAVLLSLDTDFADIVRYPPQSHAGAIVLLVQSRPDRLVLATARLVDWLATLDAPLTGHLCLTEAHRIRVRT